MPFKGFLGPSSETTDLTRILRRHSVSMIIPCPAPKRKRVYSIFRIFYILFTHHSGLAERMFPYYQYAAQKFCPPL